MTTALSRTQIDRLGNRLRKGEIAESDLRLLDDYRRTFGEGYEKVIETLKHQLALHPTGRPAKSTSSVIEKLNRESIRLSQIQDIAGCRVVVADIAAQDAAIASLSRLFPDATVVDRRNRPSYGYRAVHVIVRSVDRSVEIQVRTTLQHLWAELSEKFSDVVDPAIKYGGGKEDIREILLVQSTQVSRVEAFEQGALESGRKLPAEVESKLAGLKSEMARTFATLTAVVELWLEEQ